MTIINNISRLKDTRKLLRNNTTQAEKVLWNFLKWSKLSC
jgi:very-short-patch-repair endonuclease